MDRTKICIKKGCNKEAGNHMFYDTRLCKEHAYFDELEREDAKDLTFFVVSENNDD